VKKWLQWWGAYECYPLEVLKVFFEVAIDRNANPLKLVSFTITSKVGQEIKY